jgi:hypothetical protein
MDDTLGLADGGVADLVVRVNVVVDPPTDATQVSVIRGWEDLLDQELALVYGSETAIQRSGSAGRLPISPRSPSIPATASAFRRLHQPVPWLERDRDGLWVQSMAIVGDHTVQYYRRGRVKPTGGS